MKLHWFKRHFRVALPITGLGAVLFSGCLIWLLARPTFLHVVAVEAQAACHDMGTQWMVVVCLCVYLVAFLVLERRMNPGPRGWYSGNANLWLVAVAVLMLAHYAVAYQGASLTTQSLVLLTGMAVETASVRDNGKRRNELVQMKDFTEPNALLLRPLSGLTLVDVPLGAASGRASPVRFLEESQEAGASSMNLEGRRSRTALKSGPTDRPALPLSAGSRA
ncbi:MAG: hypothetical protein HY674_06670 [Chloroflexi bacterium]|nr:hypothetical protein [Chloroflexota bacterium]